MNRRLAVAVAAATLTLAACTTGTQEQGPAAAGTKATGQVEIWHFFTDREAGVIDGVLKDFEASHPDITLVVKGGQDDEQVKRAISAGEGPDVGLSYDTLIVGNFCRSGAFRDLNPYIQRDKIDLGNVPSTVLSYTEFEGKRCVMPALTDAYGLYYNKDLLGDRQPPRTWSELSQLAKDLTKRKPDGEIEVAGFVPLLGFYETVPSRFAPAAEAQWLESDGTSALGSDPAWTEFLTWQKELVDWYGYENLQKFTAGLGQEFAADNGFQTGKIALHIDGEYRMAYLRKEAPDLRFGTAPVPTPDDRTANYGAGNITGNIIGISKGSKNPEAAWELIKYLTTDTGAQVKLSNGLKNLPTTAEALDSPQLEKDANFQVFLDMLKHPKSGTTPPTSNGNAYVEAFTNFGQQWESGQVPDLKAGLTDLDTQIDEALKVAG
jgi:multiple sugar transport system substrate-binding protein